MRPHSQIGTAGAGLVPEIDGPVPAHLSDWWTHELWCLHCAEVETADSMPDGWLDWHRFIAPNNAQEITALEADRGHYLGFMQAEGAGRPETQLSGPLDSVPPDYRKAPLLADLLSE